MALFGPGPLSGKVNPAPFTGVDGMCLIKHNMCMKRHIYPILASRRRALGMSQQELAARAGLRREKLNRIESREQNIGIEELCRLLDVVGLELHVREKGQVDEQGERQSLPLHSVHQPAPREFDKASFIDGSRAKILSWGKMPR